jgi:hypothetical protein
MKKLFLVIVFILSSKSFAQLTFSSGFEAGYKAGYCYGRPSCVTPLVPNTPAGGFSYKDGYNKGFQMGYDSQRGVGNKNPKGYIGTPAEFIDNTMYRAPYELMMKIIDQKDKEFEDKYGSYENREKIFNEQLLKGLDAFKRGDYYGAINFCNRAEETLLTNPMIDMILGGSYYFLDNLDYALYHLKRAKKNGYNDADTYIKIIKGKEKTMDYERVLKYGAKIGYNFNSLKSSPLYGAFIQFRGFGTKNNFNFIFEVQISQSYYTEIELNPWFPNGEKTHLEKDNVFQTNYIFKNALTKNLSIVYGPSLGASFNGVRFLFDLNAGLQYKLTQHFFIESKYVRNLSKNTNPNIGSTNVNEPNNFQLSLGYKF